jgi:hypothetical protein
MNENQKAQKYGELLNEHTRVSNKIQEIKGQSIELSKQQELEIRQLQSRQVQIFEEMRKLFN